ncbi:molybdopterin molybdotransferase MoeA [Sphingomonas sp. DT-204]|uniref:molybdopterin molybdotransferase MoeA n=1 Tax=Sphingomonas sp. DT-204 TaxID=3396166 RepID=UPI003F19884A
MTYAEPVRAAGTACAATLGFDAAQAILAAHAAPLGIETVPLARAGRRVLAAPVHARIDAPRHDAAAMDGYAVREADLARHPHLRVAGASYPARPWQGTLGEGETVRIMTGAAMPAGADRVLMREHVTAADGWIALADTPSPRPHVRRRGSDIAAGVPVLPAGRMLDPRALVAAAAADVAEVSVWRRPRVHVIANGDELVPSGRAAATACHLPDSLTEALLLLARQWGGVPVGAALVPDDPVRLRVAAEAALADAEVLVMAGGASRGDRDFAKAALAPLGLELAFRDIAIKPGKPVWYARIGDRHVLGLPGNPTAAMTVARLFLAPLLTALGGRGFAAGLGWRELPLIAVAPETGNRESFLCAQRDEAGVRVIERQSASGQLMLAVADLLVRRPAHAPALDAGAPVDVLSF